MARIAAAWAGVAAVLTAVVLVLDFITNVIGITDRIIEFIDKPNPTVAIKPRDTDWGGQCLAFTFADLPLDFALGTIRLDVVDAVGPASDPGNQAAKILEKVVHDELPVTVFLDREPIDVAAKVISTRTKDAFYLDYCPTLDEAGVSGRLTVEPSYLSPLGDVIDIAKRPSGAVEFSLTRPKNLSPNVEAVSVRKPSQ